MSPFSRKQFFSIVVREICHLDPQTLPPFFSCFSSFFFLLSQDSCQSAPLLSPGSLSPIKICSQESVHTPALECLSSCILRKTGEWLKVEELMVGPQRSSNGEEILSWRKHSRPRALKVIPVGNHLCVTNRSISPAL